MSVPTKLENLQGGLRMVDVALKCVGATAANVENITDLHQAYAWLSTIKTNIIQDIHDENGNAKPSEVAPVPPEATQP